MSFHRMVSDDRKGNPVINVAGLRCREGEARRMREECYLSPEASAKYQWEVHTLNSCGGTWCAQCISFSWISEVARYCDLFKNRSIYFFLSIFISLPLKNLKSSLIFLPS